jgi:hypothetical protein
MNESFQGIRAKLLFGAIGNAIATVIYILLFWNFFKDPSKIIGPSANDPSFLSFWAAFFPGVIILGALSIAISLIGVGFLLHRFDNARQAMRTSNRWKDMLLVRAKDQILMSNFGLLAAPAAATIDENAIPLKGSERVVVIMKAEPFDLSALLSQALPTVQKKNATVQIPGAMPLFLREHNWEKVQVLFDPNGKTPRLIKNEQGGIWGVLQTRSAFVSQLVMVVVRMPKDLASVANK